MESPVRIFIGAALVVTLLLLDSTARVTALNDTTTTTSRFENSLRHNKSSTSPWIQRGRQKTPDLALNELNSKSSTSEENADRNAKYKDRGRIRFGSHVTSSTESPKRRKASTEAASAANLMIVTPTPPKKNMTEIIDSMRKYKNTKMPYLVSSTTPLTTIKQDDDESDESESEEDHDDEFEKFTSSNFHDSDNFFTIPSFDDEHFGHDHQDPIKDSTNNNKMYKDYSIPTYGKYSSYFPKEISYKPKDDDDDEPFKSSYFNFDTELTTPKNDFFDKKYRKISSSIIKHLDSIKLASPPTNQSVPHKLRTENGDVEIINSGTPNNKSTVIIKNTKEIRVSDNEGAGSANKELSDTVHGTSIYYEMSVLSTETYGIDNEDDCDNDTSPLEPTPSTTKEQELASIKTTFPISYGSSNKPITVETKSEIVSTASSSYNPAGYSSPIASSVSSFWSSSPNSILSTEKTATRLHFGNQNNRNRGYTKRYNYSSTKLPNTTPTYGDESKPVRLSTRRFQYSTPKSKPVWMAPKRNVTRKHYNRNPTPTTIYHEYFEVQNKSVSTKRPPPIKTVLTTVSSDIDPVLQGEVGVAKKVVHSQSASDNSIPTLWKRGSTKYTTTSSSATTADNKDISEMEIPPTLAWALASLRSPPGPPSLKTPPTSGSLTNNDTSQSHRNVDENELQKVGEPIEVKETTTSSTAGTTVGINNVETSKKIVDIDQNKLAWRPVLPLTTTPKVENQSNNIASESKSERQPAESNISQTTVSPITEPYTAKITTADDSYFTETVTQTTTWIPVNGSGNEVSTEESTEEDNAALPPLTPTKSTVFESITKLPSGITTPVSDDSPRLSSYKTEYRTEINTQSPTTIDNEVTTIRFTYVPTITEETTQAETTEKPTTESEWVPVAPTRTKLTTIEDRPITTYRPIYSTAEEETVTEIPSTTSIRTESTTLEEKSPTEKNEYSSTLIEKEITTEKTLDRSTQDESNNQETSTMIVQVVTEINSERAQPEMYFTTKTMPEFTELSTPNNMYDKEESKSEENSGSNEVITPETTVHVTEPTTPTQTEEIKLTEAYTTVQQKTETTKIKEQTTTTDQNQEPTVTKEDLTTVSTTEYLTTKSVNELEDLTSYSEDVTTEASSRVLGAEEARTGATVAIVVSTIGVIALILLIGLLMVVRRRGRRGVYAQRCTPVSLDAYSLDSVSVGHRKGNQRLRASKGSYGNPAYDDEVTSHPMQYAALASFALDVESMSAEFTEIPSVSVRPEEVPPGCEDKNRYSNVLPLPETRVPLKRLGSDPTTEYINANYITGPGNIKNYYILCQAPLSNTVGDFWRMMWEQNSRLIVMLTEYMENGVEKCYEYLPPSEVSDNRRSFGDFQIILKKREQRDKYAISTIQLINQKTRHWREVTHLWYFWPAKGVPDDYESVIEFLSEMRGYMKMSQGAKEYDDEGIEVIYGDQSRSTLSSLSNFRSDDGGAKGLGLNVYSPQRAEEQLRRGTNGTLGRMKVASEVDGGVRPCVVVCASGAGRGAAVVALDVAGRALAAGAVDLPRVVREIRAQRPHSLTNKHHYIFLYKVLSEYGNKLMGGGVDTI